MYSVVNKIIRAQSRTVRGTFTCSSHSLPLSLRQAWCRGSCGEHPLPSLSVSVSASSRSPTFGPSSADMNEEWEEKEEAKESGLLPLFFLGM